MYIKDSKAYDVNIAYIGGGSRGWAWGLMTDLTVNGDMNGNIRLYDIDLEAAKDNEIIGNKYKTVEGANSCWECKAVESLKEALIGADFVVISILPGTFDEMESDVHAPEKYGIYQSVGDTAGPGGIIRALRTLPMMEEIALAIKEYSPDAWVINYTNPMTLSVAALYSAFPEIKAFGCCHEVFGTQKLLQKALKEFEGIETDDRRDIKVNVTGVNHFTWLTNATYRNIDLFPVYEKFCEKYYEDGYVDDVDNNWMNSHFLSAERVKMDLFKRFGYIAAAGDRHLAEFCDSSWYLKDPETVKKWHFGLTTVEWRKKDLEFRLGQSADMIKGIKPITLCDTGEEGINQMRALLGLCDIVTNVNLPNRGQIPNLPLGAVVETNAVFRANSLVPINAGNVPEEIYPLIAPVVGEQQLVLRAFESKKLEYAYKAFAMDRLVHISLSDSKKLFDEMVKNTSKYLGMYL